MQTQSPEGEKKRKYKLEDFHCCKRDDSALSYDEADGRYGAAQPSLSLKRANAVAAATRRLLSGPVVSVRR